MTPLPWHIHGDEPYIYLHENHKIQSNVGKYTSCMDRYGFGKKLEKGSKNLLPNGGAKNSNFSYGKISKKITLKYNSKYANPLLKILKNNPCSSKSSIS